VFRDRNLGLLRTLTAKHRQLLEDDTPFELNSPRLSQVPPPAGPPPATASSSSSSSSSSSPKRPSTGLTINAGSGGGGGGSGNSWRATAPPDSPTHTLRGSSGSVSPGFAPRAPLTPAAGGGGFPLTGGAGTPGRGPRTPRTLAEDTAALTPTERTRRLSEAGRALFAASQKTFRFDNTAAGGDGGELGGAGDV
jgi:hypothetical protein